MVRNAVPKPVVPEPVVPEPVVTSLPLVPEPVVTSLPPSGTDRASFTQAYICINIANGGTQAHMMTLLSYGAP